MQAPGRIAALAAFVLAVTGTPAAAADFCVALPARDGCTEQPTVAAALDVADDDATLDRVFVGEIVEEGTFADAPGRPVEILGAGTVATRLDAAAGPGLAIRLSDPASLVRWVTIGRTGPAGGVVAELMAGAELADSIALGGIAAHAGGAGDQPARVLRVAVVSEDVPALDADGARLFAESVEVVVNGTVPALRAACSADADAALEGRHLTVTGKMDTGATTGCEGDRRADLALANSVLAGTYGADGPFARSGNGALTTAWSWHGPDKDAMASDPLPPGGDPGFVSADDRRLRADSPLVDAGDPAPLAAGEGLNDAAGFVRIVDGSGDGVVRRDVGAHERQPQPPAPPAGNVLSNPGAEAPDLLAGWSGTGGFEAALFGADDFFPTRPAAGALGAGTRFFAGGTAADSALTQRIDVAGSAAAIDGGGASATLSALLGGYGADADEIRADAIFRDPAGEPLGTITLTGPTPAERGNATNLLARAASAGIPPRTRAVDVVLSAHRVAGSYTDGYADNLALTLSVPGIAVPGPVDPGAPVIPGLKPFAGLTVLTARPSLSAKGAVRIGLGCESATVGRCSGTLELRAVPKGRKTAVRIARFGVFSMRPGQTQTVVVKLLLARRRAFLKPRSFRATVHVVARDGQGLERRKTVPVRVVRSRPRRR